MEKVEKLTSLIDPYLGVGLTVGLIVAVVLLIGTGLAVAGLRREMRRQLGDQRAVLREIRDDIGDDVAHNRQQMQESLGAGLMRLQDLLDRRIAARCAGFDPAREQFDLCDGQPPVVAELT